MGILLYVFKMVGIASDVITIENKYQSLLSSHISFEKLLAHSLTLSFQNRKENLKPFAQNGFLAKFNELETIEALKKINNLNIEDTEGLIKILLPIVSEIIYINDFDDKNNPEYLKEVEEILREGIDKFWVLINNYDTLVNEILISNSIESKEGISEIKNVQKVQGIILEEYKTILKEISEKASSVGLPPYNEYTEKDTPKEQSFGEKVFINPFAEVRAEDFNHNYKKLATLFQSFPEWDSVTSRTNNVFIIGGRGTGKSMILRRMSIQTTISDYHNNGNKEIKLSEIKEDYFGIYIKLIRGTFDQYENNNSIPKNQSDFLAQHELNIKIIDAFRDSISWLIKKSVLTFTDFELKALLKDRSEERRV